ncbi:hypothetical protein DBR32_00475 [Taibaiella sp. KBW10]|uniref:DNA polymerase III subunit psi n=1 Tax=Taibaiella sp. KBW10 TaxID=2153357 RepID=UPI000F5AE4AB|nr:DNA polymerase III subunit psi [Taibaiella sp. KBW10]RQO32123.1 hypothetical protein DBR32_00475 [Taibaiella sp. KBW10]
MHTSLIQQLFAKETIVSGLPNFNTLATGNEVRVLVIVQQFQQEAEDKEQITKIFKACQLSPEQLYITDQRTAWANINAVDSIKEVFLFNVDPKELSLNYKLFPYRMLSINEKKIMLVDDLRSIMNNAQLKADFWNKSLKPYYIGQ